MRFLRLAALFGAIAFLVGCDVLSLNPLYDDASLALEPTLVGSWKAGTNETWTFTPAGKKMYKLVIKEVEEGEEEPRTKETKFDAGLVRLSGRLFLDLMSDDSGSTGVPAHLFARIEIENDVLHIGWVDDSWMKDKLKKETWLTSLPAAHDKTLITSPTRDLQYFFRNHAWNDEAYLSGTRGHPDDLNTDLSRIP